MRFDALPMPPSALGESPFWWPEQGALYWLDINGRQLNRWSPVRSRHDFWRFDEEPGCCAPLPGGALLIALRSGLVRFDPQRRQSQRLAKAPYDTASQRFNDGKADPQGRFWAGTVCEPREPAMAALYRWSDHELARVCGGVSTSNGLAWSPDGRTMYWSDTQAHRIDAFDFDGEDGSLSRRRVFAQFARKSEVAPADYIGRPDGAAVDAEGCLWVAMYEGARLLRLAPDGQVVHTEPVPVQCPTMPCFGGADLRTLYVTSGRHGRPAAELEAQPWAGCVLAARARVGGLPVNFAVE
jgi:sugar lactone lactonase YvrE